VRRNWFSGALIVAATVGCSSRELVNGGSSPPSADSPVSVAPAIIPITCKKPEYPTESFKANESGSVLLRFFINVDGDVTQSQIERSSGYDRLDEAARTVLQACKFRPGSINGRPVAAWAPV